MEISVANDLVQKKLLHFTHYTTNVPSNF